MMLKVIAPIYVTVFIAAVGYGVSFPLLGYRVEQLAVPGWMLGINTAMPALGWVLGSAAIPLLQLRFRIPIGVLAVAFLCCAALATVGLRFAEGFAAMTLLRFAFGGALGLFFRSVEYWVNALSPDTARGRNLGLNGIAFMAGLVVGSAAQPALGTAGWIPFGAVLATVIVAIAMTSLWPRLALPPEATPSVSAAKAYVAAAPIAYAAALAYGLYECVPAYLNQIYALRHGIDPNVAALALTAAAIGNILLPLPIALLSDRIGRIRPLAASAAATGALALLIPYTLTDPRWFLLAVGVCAGLAGAVYGLGLALIGDRFQEADLVTANAVFGIVYATASVLGPLINGVALDSLYNNGLAVSAFAVFAALLTIVFLFSRRGHGRCRAT